MQANVSWVDARLRYIKAIFHVQYQSLLSFYGRVSHFHNLVKVVILKLISVDFKDVLKSIQEMVECRLVLQNEQVDQVVNCASLMR